MVEWRVYAATTGRCLAGERNVDYKNEQHRIEQDFASGIRFVVDNVRNEIRGFVPVDRGSREAFFFITVFSESEPVSISQHLSIMAECFEQRDRWQIRTNTPEGRLVEWLQDATNGKLEVERSYPVDDNTYVKIPDYRTAAFQLVEFCSQSLSTESVDDRIAAISLSKSINHMDYDILFHVASDNAL